MVVYDLLCFYISCSFSCSERWQMICCAMVICHIGKVGLMFEASEALSLCVCTS